MIIPPQVISEIRGEDARRFKAIPVAFGESGLVVAVGNLLDIDTMIVWVFFCNGSWNWFARARKKSGKHFINTRHGR